MNIKDLNLQSKTNLGYDTVIVITIIVITIIVITIIALFMLITIIKNKYF
jgi:hypothetical protein